MANFSNCELLEVHARGLSLPSHSSFPCLTLSLPIVETSRSSNILNNTMDPSAEFGAEDKLVVCNGKMVYVRQFWTARARGGSECLGLGLSAARSCAWA